MISKKEKRMTMLKIGLIICSLTCVFLINCSKHEEIVLKPRLFITLKDEAGKSVPDATVRLYKNEQDPGFIKTTDSSGVVIFDSLETEIYYWHAEKECKTNRNSQTTLNRPLIPGVILYGYSVMSETGVLKITNTSTEPYHVTDSLSLNIVLNDTPYITYPKVGDYLIYTEKVNIPGIARDTLIQIACGDTINLILPY